VEKIPPIQVEQFESKKVKIRTLDGKAEAELTLPVTREQLLQTAIQLAKQAMYTKITISIGNNRYTEVSEIPSLIDENVLDGATEIIVEPAQAGA
jgi:hypothetical protein